MYCIYLIKFKSLITIAFMEGFQKKFELTPFRMWLLELTLFKTTALPLALFHFFIGFLHYWEGLKACAADPASKFDQKSIKTGSQGNSRV